MQNSKKQNSYNLLGEYGIGYTSKGEEFYFDLEDYEKIKDYCWYINSSGYVQTNIYDISKKKQRQIKMHRFVMNVTETNVLIDYIYHKKNDNRKSQLRIVTNQQNQFNSSIKQSNTSKRTGVYFHKRKNKWLASIGYNGKNVYLGMFDLYDDAVNARIEAENKYFGEYKYNS